MITFLLTLVLSMPASAERVVTMQTAAVFEPLLAPARYKGAYGGRGSAKSHFFADLAIDDCLRHPGMRFVCIREVQNSLQQSVKLLLEDKIKAYDLTGEFQIMESKIITPGGGMIIFKGMQDYAAGSKRSGTADSIKSLEGFHRAWIEEAQTLSERSLTLLRPTMFRQVNSEIWASWNPRFATDPIDQLFRGPHKHPDAIVVRSSYRNNPWLPRVLLRDIEWDRTRDHDKYEHVWNGGYEQHAEARVFKNWRVEAFETPADAVFLYGGDWGFSIDPAVLVRCFLSGKTLCIDQAVRKIGVEIDDLPALFGLVDGSRDWPIVADSARPETISYMQHHGFPRMEAARKGPDSVKEGVIFLQGYDIVVHPNCMRDTGDGDRVNHVEDELTHYKYKVDRLTGIVTPFLEDKKNHVIDSLRYATEKARQPVEFYSW